MEAGLHFTDDKAETPGRLRGLPGVAFPRWERRDGQLGLLAPGPVLFSLPSWGFSNIYFGLTRFAPYYGPFVYVSLYLWTWVKLHPFSHLLLFQGKKKNPSLNMEHMCFSSGLFRGLGEIRTVVGSLSWCYGMPSHLGPPGTATGPGLSPPSSKSTSTVRLGSTFRTLASLCFRGLLSWSVKTYFCLYWW